MLRLPIHTFAVAISMARSLLSYALAPLHVLIAGARFELTALSLRAHLRNQHPALELTGACLG